MMIWAFEGTYFTYLPIYKHLEFSEYTSALKNYLIAVQVKHHQLTFPGQIMPSVTIFHNTNIILVPTWMNAVGDKFYD